MKTKIILSSVGGSLVVASAAVGIAVPLSSSNQEKSNIETTQFSSSPEFDFFSYQISYINAYDDKSLNSFLSSLFAKSSDLLSTYNNYFRYADKYINVLLTYDDNSANFEESSFKLAAKPLNDSIWDDFGDNSSKVITVTLTNLDIESKNSDNQNNDDSDVNVESEENDSDLNQDEQDLDENKDITDDENDENQDDEKLNEDNDEQTNSSETNQINPIAESLTWVNNTNTTKIVTDQNGVVSGYSSNNDLIATNGKFTFYDGKINAPGSYWKKSVIKDHEYKSAKQIIDIFGAAQYCGAITVEMNENTRVSISWPGVTKKWWQNQLVYLYDGYYSVDEETNFIFDEQAFTIKAGGFMTVSNGDFVATNAYINDLTSFNVTQENSKQVITGNNKAVYVNGDVFGECVFTFSNGSFTLTDNNGIRTVINSPKGNIKRITKNKTTILIENWLTRVGNNGKDTKSSYSKTTYKNIESIEINKGYVTTNGGYSSDFYFKNLDNFYKTQDSLYLSIGDNYIGILDGTFYVDTDFANLTNLYVCSSATYTDQMYF